LVKIGVTGRGIFKGMEAYGLEGTEQDDIVVSAGKRLAWSGKYSVIDNI
jgi:hypothetical protein